ncbi:hypothetical protein [Bacillus wiedmannii]|uniref:hypothetical protein n=1 Tax=Bacillus wiedmannii TaxID=1890302 RepID=UPI000BEB94BB|nr:hypothetical protein [Bacillus wiedmannii]PEA42827.1 hypothetical protein CON83_19565 [Bacillus wiedmannii]
MRKSDTEIEIEIVVLSAYCDIIMKLLSNSVQLSVLKTIIFAYLLKKEEYQYQKLFRGNTKKDLTLKYLSTLNGELEDIKLNMPYIINAIDLLNKSKKIAVKGSNIIIQKSNDTSYSGFSKFVQKAIAESENFSDEQFLKEVLANV